jgi:hypothetical protein
MDNYLSEISERFALADFSTLFADKRLIKLYSTDQHSYNMSGNPNSADSPDRLALLGDSILDFACLVALDHLYPESTTGYVTQRKSQAVSNRALGVFVLETNCAKAANLPLDSYSHKRLGTLAETMVGSVYRVFGHDPAVYTSLAIVGYILKIPVKDLIFSFEGRKA